MRTRGKSGIAVVAASAALLIGAGTVGGYAAGMIGSKQIKDNSIRSIDIKDGTLKKRDLKPKLVDKFSQPGPAGPEGPAGPPGPAGGPGADPNHVYVGAFGDVVAPRAADVDGLSMVGDGVKFGPFANGGGCDVPGADYARLDFNPLNGTTLADVTQLTYTGWFVADTDTGGVGSPTLRVNFPADGGGTNTLTFSPNTQFNKGFNSADEQGQMHTWMVTQGTLRLNDSAGNNPAGELPWSHWVDEFGDAEVSNINILNGCQAGANLTSIVRSIEANGTTYDFGTID